MVGWTLMAMAYPKFWILIPIELARAAAATKLATEVPTLPARYARSMVTFGAAELRATSRALERVANAIAAGTTLRGGRTSSTFG